MRYFKNKTLLNSLPTSVPAEWSVSNKYQIVPPDVSYFKRHLLEFLWTAVVSSLVIVAVVVVVVVVLMMVVVVVVVMVMVIAGMMMVMRQQ